jgi:transcriptional regulator with XRE-family HTH domain
MNKRVIEIRKYKGLNQTDFAKKLGFTQANLSAIELGKILLTEANIRLICLTFGIREEWLREGTGDMVDDEAQLSDYEKRLLELFRRLSPMARITLIEYAEKTVAIEAAARGETPDASKQAPGGIGKPSEAPQEGETPGIGPIPRKDGDTG